MFDLRPYQIEGKREITAAWERGARNVAYVLPTGGGKTVTISDIVRDESGAVVVIAHRQELVSQISLALARNGVRHRIIGPPDVVKLCVAEHMLYLGRSYFDPRSSVAVAGVDTLIRRESQLAAWCRTVRLWVIDECHHVLRENKWGAAVAMFPNARGLGVTATPERADGYGLGRHADGVIDVLVEGPAMRKLIRDGYLTDYRIFSPPSDLDVSDVSVGKTGDYVKPQIKTALRRSSVIGDIVKHYLRIAPGKSGVTFVTDTETAADVAARFNEAGVAAAVVTAKTPAAERAAIIRRFRARELLQLVNVDLFGEGFDLPAIEVVSMARPTCSYGLYVQQFGRALRLLDGKHHGIIIDHVGNVERHGLPDRRRVWTLDRRDRRSRAGADDTDMIPTWTCLKCTGVWERVYKSCQDPMCAEPRPAPSARNAPEMVDGDLHELDAATLAAMRGEIERVDMDPEAYRIELAGRRVPIIGQLANVKRHAARQDAQAELRDAIAWWAGYQRAALRPDSESYRRFYFAFGVDVLTAQTLGTKEATALAASVHLHIAKEAAGL